MPRANAADDISNVYKRLTAADLSHAASDFALAFSHITRLDASHASERSRAHEACQAAFTSLALRGLLTPFDPTSTAAPDPAAKLSTWLRTQFDSFLDLNTHILSQPLPFKSAAGDETVALLNAKSTALSTWSHFMVATASTPAATRFSVPLLTRFLQPLLTVSPSTVQPFLSRIGGASSQSKSIDTGVVAALEATLQAFRSSYMDEFDDVRFYSLRVVASLCSNAETVHGADLNAFITRCVELLLSISLPATQVEWDAAPHDSLIARFAAEHGIQPELQDSDDDAGDEQPDTDGTEGASAPGDAPVSAMAAVRAVGSGAARRNRPKGVVNAAEAAAAWKKRPRLRVREKLIDYGEDEKDAEEGETAAALPPPVAAVTPTATAGAPRYSCYATVRRAYAHAWTCLLQLELPQAALTRVLLSLPSSILPLMPHPYPQRLADFLMASYARGGAHALLSLHSLFILMTRHGLEVPRFYASLYALLTPPTMHARYRARFFTLLDMFMSSSALPAYLVAAFVKRCARLALTAPTPSVLYLLTFIHNCCARHPSVVVLLHRATAVKPTGSSSWPHAPDTFDPSSNDPSTAHALESSLWELTALAQHSFAPVAHAVRALMKDGALGAAAHSLAGTGDRGATPFAVARQVVADVAKSSAATYEALVGEELGRRVRKAGQEATLPDVPFAFKLEAAASGGEEGASATAASLVLRV